ncbi:peptidoglycan-recognition protein LE-like isoform X2 [Copidosoma floridanum]|uniref:peptidoglycan-recognition protein LE-like isoform X2 n=1 Tax=Copidosoma floridanum TaxID=29053 RepID=UPI0006C95F98|nr:peptidoglycan-recognition protein LE-like isoform X2 [Copidosoma floridanum]
MAQAYGTVILEVDVLEDKQRPAEEPAKGPTAAVHRASKVEESNCGVYSDADEDGDGSSTSSSDAEAEEAPEEELAGKGWLAHRMNGVALPSVEPPNFGNVKVENSTNVHLGNRTFYKGPVTIKQVVYASNTTTAVVDSKNGAVTDSGTTSLDGSSVTFCEQPAWKGARVSRFVWRHRCTIAVATVAVIVVALITTIALQLSDPTFEGVRIVSRVEWVAQPPVKPPAPLKVHPAVYVIISHTATIPCFTQAQCVLNVRYAQTFHIESKGWNDISYNFLVGGDGLVYEGRGWGIEGAHTFNYNIKSIGISFIGTFNSEKPTNAQVHAAKKLIELGVEKGEISPDYKLLGHRQCIKTESPGQVLYEIIQTWDHWSPTP